MLTLITLSQCWWMWERPGMVRGIT